MSNSCTPLYSHPEVRGIHLNSGAQRLPPLVIGNSVFGERNSRGAPMTGSPLHLWAWYAYNAINQRRRTDGARSCGHILNKALNERSQTQRDLQVLSSVEWSERPVVDILSQFDQFSVDGGFLFVGQPAGSVGQSDGCRTGDPHQGSFRVL